jgi:signal transduction histidine kinase
MDMRPRIALLAALVVGAGITLLIAGLPFVNFAYQNPSLHLAVEMVAAFVGLVAAYLLYGRYRESQKLSDLALICALALFGAKNLAFEALPTAFAASQNDFLTWTPLLGGLLATTTFAVSAFLPERTLARAQRDAAVALLACVASLVVIAGAVAVARGYLPRGIDPTLSPEASNRPRVAGNSGVLVLQLVVMVLFFAAAFGFTRRAERTGDELMTWLGAGAALGGFARFNYFLFPSIYSQWVYTGDILRLLFWLVVLIGLFREIGTYWRRLAAVGALEERRRLARDIHDGLAQELAFIAAHARRLSQTNSSRELAEHVAEAAERALDEARNAIDVLTLPLDEPLDAAVARAAEDVAARVGVRLRWDLAEAVEASPEIRETLVRIVREAVTNAARHGRASCIRVGLESQDGVLRLRIADDGVGFDPHRVGGGFGLRSMRERAREHGGETRVSSTPGGGTEVVVEIRR